MPAYHSVLDEFGLSATSTEASDRRQFQTCAHCKNPHVPIGKFGAHMNECPEIMKERERQRQRPQPTALGATFSI